jgi:predicted NBD/HSP70 family sugar kinase
VSNRTTKAESLYRILSSLVHGPKSKREIQEYTGMSWGTCSAYINLLYSNQVIDQHETEIAANQPGPKAVRFSLSETHHLIMGMEVAPNAIVSSLMDLGGNEIYSREKPLESPPNSSSMVSTIIGEWNEVRAQRELRRDEIECLALSLTGALDRDALQWIKSPKFEDVRNVDLRLLRKALPSSTSVRIEHDVIARATSVCDARDLTPGSYAFLYVADGLGLAFYDGKKFQIGSRGLAGEIGHIPYPGTTLLEPDRCFCGQDACIETLLSTKGIVRTINKWKGTEESELSGALSLLNGTEAEAIRDEIQRLLSYLMVLVTNLFDPGLIMVGGSAIGPWLGYLQNALPDQVRQKSWMSGPPEILWFTEQESNPADGAARVVAPEVRSLVIEKIISSDSD